VPSRPSAIVACYIPFPFLKEIDFLFERTNLATRLFWVVLVWPGVAAAQEQLPRVSFVHTQSAASFSHLADAFAAGLEDAGFVDDLNVAIDYHWAEGRVDLLPAIMAELVERDVAVIFTGGGAPSALAAQAATDTIPIVFLGGSDPVEMGLVESLGRPGGHITGIHMFNMELASKRMGLLLEMVPSADTIAVLLDPFLDFEIQSLGVMQAAIDNGRQVDIFTAGTEAELDAVLAGMARTKPEAMLVGVSPFFNSHRNKVVEFASQLGIPAIYEQREFTVAGGLMSYGTSLTEAYRQGGIYVGAIIAGAKPADLPVLRSMRFELVINGVTAERLGLEVPLSLLAQATEVIE
jgi:putative ABC transport system substrate-binding protein